ncbi:MAG TPA: Uma2 family endonuclease [Pirellulales bacterium]|nr:Uma2 family endonuclease [Pirellulales bacterium]
MTIDIERRIAPLAAGDKLTREEFLRLWEDHPEIKCAELIGGIVYMPSPVSVEHNDMDGSLGIWLGTYRVATPGTASGHNGTLFLQDDTPQADLNLRILPDYGGASWVEGSYLHGVPELLVEICRSSASYDLHVKYDLYQAAKVPEYLAVLLYEREIRWHVLEGDSYQLLSPDADGLLRSRVFPGLWLDGQALLAGDMSRVLKRLQDGLQSPEHQQFVERLASRREGRGG